MDFVIKFYWESLLNYSKQSQIKEDFNKNKEKCVQNLRIKSSDN